MRQLEETLAAVAEIVAIPTMDRVALQGRADRARRRRRVARAAGLAASVALVAGLTGWGVSSLTAGHEDFQVATGPEVPEGAAARFALRLDGRIVVHQADGSLVTSEVGAEELLAATGERVWYVTHDSEVATAAIHPDGTLGTPSRLSAGPVDQAVAATSRDGLAWLDLDQRLHVVAFSDGRTVEHPWADPADRLLDVHGDRWVSVPAGLPRRVEISSERGTVVATASFDVVDAQLAGGVLAVNTVDGTELFDPATGDRVRGSLGGTLAALAPTGDELATGYAWETNDQGERPTVAVVSTRGVGGGDHRVVPGVAEPAAQIQWLTDGRFLVATDRGQVFACEASDQGTCGLVYTAQMGDTRMLPTS